MGLFTMVCTGSWYGICKYCKAELDKQDKESNCIGLCRSCYSGSDNHVINRNSKYGQ